MAGSVSPATGRAYGVARVCKVWGVARSSFYLARRLAQDPAPLRPKGRRGPKPSVSDATLIDALRADLARSPRSGQGHRKVWARLRVLDGLKVARKRILRLMRENALLSPHRARPRPGEDHDRKIVTDAPNVMWATDGPQITTVRDGKVWLFATVEHWNAEALGWHMSKRGTRREAVQAMSMAVRQQFGHLGRDAARGVQLRHDHASCFMADEFQKQIKAWGMTPSFAFLGQPETNGVVERFFRTLKEQIVHGRVFGTSEHARAAVRDFIARYNAEWLVEKNAHLSPTALRRQHELAAMPMAA
ncbi:MAG: transposase [Brevundimonas sp.]|uniref:transposase n=1 Tax=Brevundimonas sp. TaxID=1871086 RepID=UPI003919BAA7